MEAVNSFTLSHGPATFFILSQMNPVHPLPNHFSMIHFWYYRAIYA
jgi:hypothetical protein